MLVRLKFCETLKEAVALVEQGRIPNTIIFNFVVLVCFSLFFVLSRTCYLPLFSFTFFPIFFSFPFYFL